MTANASSTYQITPQHEGTYTIPAIHAGNAASQPLTLRVLKDASGASPSAQPAPPAQTMPPSPNGPVVMPPQSNALAQGDADSTPIDRFGSIKITLPKKEFYVGELVPVDIKAYLPNQIHTDVDDLPQFTSDGFTLNSLSNKPQQSVETIDGRSYTVLTWHSALTGVKVGDYPFNLQMPITVIVPQQMPQMPQMDANDLFNNFFRNAMAGMGQKKNVTIQSAAETLKVLALPQANRPADFSGAVGQFEIEASASPTSVNVGDPITLRLKISGTGNFDRVSTEMLASDSHWKTYSPKNHFDAEDSVGYQGTKTFEQPVIPNEAGATSIPAVSFSYFNPETKQYVTRTTAPVAVTIGGSSVAPAASNPVVAAAPAPTPTSAAPPSPSSVSTPALELRPNKIEAGSFVSTLKPLYLNPLFLTGQGIPLLALLGGLAFIRRRNHAAHPERLRATAVQQAIRQQIQAMDEAIKNQQSSAFFVHARAALQQRFGHQWNMRPETITLADLEAHLGSQNENVRSIFAMADQASYSDLHLGEADLRHWREITLKELPEKI